MFYLLHGKDTYRSREKLRELLESFRAKVSGAAFFTIDEDSFSESEFDELLKAKSLFDKKYIVTAEGLLASKDSRDFVAGKLEHCAKSENIFIFLEEEIEENFLEEIKKFAAKIQQFKLLEGVKLRNWFNDKGVPLAIAKNIISKCGSDLWRASKEIEKYSLGGLTAKQEAGPDYNPFAICDVFAERNKSKMWIIYQQALMQGIEAEELFFKVLWQIKNLLVVKKLIVAGVKDIGKDSGLKSFVAKKAIRSANNFTEEELENYSFEMLKIYHKERRGEGELPIEFEKLLISSNFPRIAE